MCNTYILQGKEPILENDIIKWGEWLENANNQIKISNISDKIHVSTVFLGLDHGFDGEILLFETMVFGGKYDGHCDRYSTWNQAEIGHEKIMELLNK